MLVVISVHLFLAIPVIRLPVWTFYLNQSLLVLFFMHQNQIRLCVTQRIGRYLNKTLKTHLNYALKQSHEVMKQRWGVYGWLQICAEMLIEAMPT